MARTHLRVAARPDVWSELVAYVITAETATTAVQSWRADGLSPTRGLPAPRNLGDMMHSASDCDEVADLSPIALSPKLRSL